METPVVFRSAVDTWLGAIVGGVPILIIASIAPGFHEMEGTALAVPLGLVLISAALSLWLLLRTQYSVSDTSLEIASGPFKWSIPVQSITRVTPSNSALASPALSMRRLEIEYRVGSKHKSVLISPKNRESFVDALSSRSDFQGQLLESQYSV